MPSGIGRDVEVLRRLVPMMVSLGVGLMGSPGRDHKSTFVVVTRMLNAAYRKVA